jgi:hypothetical protein
MSNEESERITTSQDVISRLYDKIDEQQARIAELEDDLQFVERWAVHHGSKPSISAEEALSCIQHYPAIHEITKSYKDGKRPDTFNPYARIAELEKICDEQQAGAEHLRAQLAAAPQAVQDAVPEAIEQMAVDRYKVVPSHESMFHRWAVVAGNGTQQLYIGREGECQSMARKFMGAFLDGAFVAMQNAAPAHPAEGVPAQPLQKFESPRAKILMQAWQEGFAACRDAEYVGEEAENDAFNQSMTLNHCIAEDELHATQPAEGAPAQEVQAAIDRFDAYFRSANGVPPNARVTVPTAEWQELRAMLSTHPTQQGMEQDAARYRWLREQKPDVWKRIGWTTWPVDQNVMDARDDEIDQALAAQAKQGGAA